MLVEAMRVVFQGLILDDDSAVATAAQHAWSLLLAALPARVAAALPVRDWLRVVFTPIGALFDFELFFFPRHRRSAHSKVLIS